MDFNFLKRKSTLEVQSPIRESTPSPLNKNIEIIEKAQLGNWDKASLVLLQLDKKRVADIAGRQVYTTPEEFDQISQRLQIQIQKVLTLADSLGLKTHGAGIQTEEIGGTKFIYFIITLAKDPKYLEQEKIAREHKDDAIIGKLLGYPDTAAEWYASMLKSAASPAEFNGFVLGLREKGMEQSEIQKLAEEKFPFLKKPAGSNEEVEREELAQFLHFRLSPDHWKEELDVVRQNKDAIRINAPQLYIKLMKGNS